MWIDIFKYFFIYISTTYTIVALEPAT